MYIGYASNGDRFADEPMSDDRAAYRPTPLQALRGGLRMVQSPVAMQGSLYIDQASLNGIMVI